MMILLAQVASALDADVLKFIASSAGGAGFSAWIAYKMFNALLNSQNTNIATLTQQLAFANESHSKHLEKEGAIILALQSLTTAVDGLKTEIKAMKGTQP